MDALGDNFLLGFTGGVVLPAQVLRAEIQGVDRSLTKEINRREDACQRQRRDNARRGASTEPFGHKDVWVLGGSHVRLEQVWLGPRLE